jgi:glycosyltransferase involved in cell wall biosynthesis
VQRHLQAAALHHRVSLVTTIYSDKPDIPRSEISETGNLLEIRVYFTGDNFRKIKALIAFRHGLGILKKLRNEKPDLIHGNIFVPGAWQILCASLIFRVPFVVSEHWTGFTRESGPNWSRLQEQLARLASRKAAFIIPVSRHLQGAMESHGLRGNYKVVPNVVNTSVFVPGEPEPNPFRVLHISSLVQEHKNTRGFLRVFERFLIDFPNAVLEIISDGPTEACLDYARELGIIDSIVVNTYKPAEFVAERMASAHVLLLFSNFENLPCVIMEALSCGLPIISTNVGGIGEFVDDSKGILIEPGNENALLLALNEMASRNRTFHLPGLRKYAVENFSMEAIAKDLEEIYRLATKNI